MLNNAQTGLIGLIFIQALTATACGDRSFSPTAPTSGTTIPASAPAPLGAIVGYVVDTAFRPLEGAKVEVMAGADAGRSTTADAQGYFAISARFDATTPFRATIGEHVVATDVPHSSSPGGQRWIVFYLEPLAAPVNIAGDYTLTLAADSACTDLPDQMRTRSYTAAIAQPQAMAIPANYFHVTVLGTAPDITQSFSSIGVAGNDLGFDLSRNHNGIPTLVEQLTPDSYLSYFPNDGFAGTSVDAAASSITTSFDGVIDYSLAGGHIRCASANHRLILTRR
jgi:hypothetical protein